MDQADKLIIFGYAGFGDCIYQYPFIKAACQRYREVYLYTPFPFLYWSLPNIKFVRIETGLKTCTESMEKYAQRYLPGPPEVDASFACVRLDYQDGMKKGIGMLPSWNSQIPVADGQMDFSIPLHPDWVKAARKIYRLIYSGKKICLLKPPGFRHQWPNAARIPKPEYFQRLIDNYCHEYTFVSIGDLSQEQYSANLSGVDIRFDNGELDLTTILALTSMSDMVIAYISMLFACAVATGTKAFCLFGGYTAPELWIDKDRMDMSKIGFIGPENPCTCHDIRHDCPRDIDVAKLDERFAALQGSGPKTPRIAPVSVKVGMGDTSKRNMLICRCRAQKAAEIAKNRLIREHFNVFTVDHTAITPYLEFDDLFIQSYAYLPLEDITSAVYTDGQEEAVKNQIGEILDRNKIDFIVNAQKLHPYANWMDEAAAVRGIKRIYAEKFFDNRMIFDWTGLQYDFPNDISRYITYCPTDEMPRFPSQTRENQPNFIPRRQLLRKYGLTDRHKVIVVFGQLMWDMSIMKSPVPVMGKYVEFLQSIFRYNTDTTFLVKLHPRYKGILRDDFMFLQCHGNVKIINESLPSLFNAFDKFLAFSSTTIFEGLVHQKKFATGGYHLCSNDYLVHQIRGTWHKAHLWEWLEHLMIDEEVWHRYMTFLCNYYAVPLGSKRLYDKFVMEPEEFYSGRGR